jgi:hypothetical protein
MPQIGARVVILGVRRLTGGWACPLRQARTGRIAHILWIFFKNTSNILEYARIYSNILDISLSGGRGGLTGEAGGRTDNPDWCWRCLGVKSVSVFNNSTWVQPKKAQIQENSLYSNNECYRWWDTLSLLMGRNIVDEFFSWRAVSMQLVRSVLFSCSLQCCRSMLRW